MSKKRNRTGRSTPEGAARQNPLLPRIVFGEWVPLFPPPDQLLGWDDLNKRVRYSNRTLETRDKEWFPLLASPNQLVGWDKIVRPCPLFQTNPGNASGNGLSTRSPPETSGSRARAKKVSGSKIALYLRLGKRTTTAHFNGGRSFDIGRVTIMAPRLLSSHEAIRRSPATISSISSSPPLAIRSRFSSTANRCCRPTIRAIRQGTFRVGGKETAYSGTLQIFIPTEESLVADNRQVVGVADPPAWRAFALGLLGERAGERRCTAHAAELRARYAQKWSQAAEDLAKVIELKPDDFSPGTVGPCCS